jgi:hypothetical protein
VGARADEAADAGVEENVFRRERGVDGVGKNGGMDFIYPLTTDVRTHCTTLGA